MSIFLAIGLPLIVITFGLILYTRVLRPGRDARSYSGGAGDSITSVNDGGGGGDCG